MTRPTLYALVAVTGAVMAGIALGMVFEMSFAIEAKLREKNGGQA